MTLSKRKMLTLVGGATVLAASATAATFLSTRTPHVAQAPWSSAGAYDDPRLNALSFALLAPNPHNLQPWKFGLDGEDGVVIYRDATRSLPETDPFGRQITIGLGCFLEQMVLAAGVMGYGVALNLFPQGEDGPVAQAVFSSGGHADPIAAHMLDRRSCKEPFLDKKLLPEQVGALGRFADIYTDAPMVDALQSLTWEAWMIEAHTPRTMQESVDLMRFGKGEINASPDGIALGGPLLESLMLVGMVSRDVQANPDSEGFKQGVAIYQKMIAATPAYAVLTSKTNSRTDQIEAGRRWLRLNLKTTAMGLALHPVSQCLQEYDEMSLLYDSSHELLAAPGQTVQMLGRLGYGPEVPRSPRWPLEAKLLNA